MGRQAGCARSPPCPACSPCSPAALAAPAPACQAIQLKIYLMYFLLKGPSVKHITC